MAGNPRNLATRYTQPDKGLNTTNPRKDLFPQQSKTLNPSHKKRKGKERKEGKEEVKQGRKEVKEGRKERK